LGGMLHLGSVAQAASVCLQIPDTVLIFGTNVTTGQRDTTVWTSSQGLSVTAVDTSTVTQRAQTSWFVPSGDVGWSVALPSVAESQVPVSKAGRCTVSG